MNFENCEGEIGYDEDQSKLKGHREADLNGGKLLVLVDFFGKLGI